MIYELRIYEVIPGRMQALQNRFTKHTIRLFEKHGIKVVGFWTEEIGTSNELVYILGYESLGDRERRWGAFQADPDWQVVRSRTEQEGGPLVARVRNTILQPTTFSPMK